MTQFFITTVIGISLWVGVLYASPVPSEEQPGVSAGSDVTGSPPDLCTDASIDTITRTQDGKTYVFKGDFYWQIDINKIAQGYPRKIDQDWGGLEGNLNASLTLHGNTYFFKNASYWKFTNKDMAEGYPRPISEGFHGIPNNLDAALTWNKTGKPYFFKGNKYWKYEPDSIPHVTNEFPKPIDDWSGLPKDGIDAAFLWDNKNSYFFKDDHYYRYDDNANRVSTDFNYPKPTRSVWFSCPVARQ